MYLQIGIWGSHELATYVMNRALYQEWFKDLGEFERGCIQALKPAMITSTRKDQYGSVLPKIQHYYELKEGSPFRTNSSFDTGIYHKELNQHLKPYYDPEICLMSRFKDKDNIDVYPYLHHESSDYFTTHNCYSPYVNEAVLRLIYRQLKNFNSEHCYMTQIRAYEPFFDRCYQSITVKNPEALKDKVCDNPIELNRSWLGQVENGYCVSDLASEHGSLDIPCMKFEDDRLISPSRVCDLVRGGKLDRDITCRIQLAQQILWYEEFNPDHVSLMYDLLGERMENKMYIVPNDDLVFLDFDWNSPS
ncbi:hypothetical protein [Enterovibrio norvegicus]|uniref:hypothetical protein n=1 Tax=Enterovibrio norvegicus TaxID=188144 RepID=UPI00352CBA26